VKVETDRQVVLNTRLENELLNIREEHNILIEVLSREAEHNEYSDLDYAFTEEDPTLMNNRLKLTIDRLKLELYNINLHNLHREKKRKKR